MPFFLIGASTIITNDRGSCSELFFKIGVLKILQYSQENKIAGLKPSNLKRDPETKGGTWTQDP